MNIFNRNTTKKHLGQFEIKIAELLSSEFPEFRKVIEMSKLLGIHFTEKPQGITLTRSFSPETYGEIKRNNNTCFGLVGISVLEKKTKKYVPIKLTYFHNLLNAIEVANPKKFHKIYDLNNIKVEEIKINQIKLENPEKDIVLKLLKKIETEKLNLLDIENTFEIEINGKSFYTILDMEDGNYIAIDESSKVYRLNHDNKESSKIISESISEFLKTYNGKKEELESIVYE